MLPTFFKGLFNTLLHNQNQFASGGLLLMVIGGIAAYFRTIPGRIYEWFLHLFSMTVTITDDSKAFIWFKWWFQEHERSKKIRHVDIITPKTPTGIQTLFFPAPGSHWFMYKGRPFRMTFTRMDGDKMALRETRPESLTLRVVGRNQQFLRHFIADVQKKYETGNRVTPTLYIYNRIYNYWEPLATPLRPWESVILPREMKESLVKDVVDFQNSKGWYDSTGMPYHRAYLLYGPPGTGKTTTLMGLAAHFKMSLYLIKLSDLDDNSLIAALHNAATNSMVVFEDVDCLDNKRKDLKKDGEAKKSKKRGEDVKGEKKYGVSLSGLLNALDGLETPPGSLFFMTTNLINNLDAALLRPGRIDKKIYLGPATTYQKVEMYNRFFPQDPTGPWAENFVGLHPELKTMAEFQEALKLKRGEA